MLKAIFINVALMEMFSNMQLLWLIIFSVFFCVSQMTMLALVMIIIAAADAGDFAAAVLQRNLPCSFGFSRFVHFAVFYKADSLFWIFAVCELTYLLTWSTCILLD